MHASQKLPVVLVWLTLAVVATTVAPLGNTTATTTTTRRSTPLLALILTEHKTTATSATAQQQAISTTSRLRVLLLNSTLFSPIAETNKSSSVDIKNDNETPLTTHSNMSNSSWLPFLQSKGDTGVAGEPELANGRAQDILKVIYASLTSLLNIIMH